MKVELQINNSTSADARFVGWAPSPCRIRVTNPSGILTQTIKIGLSSVSAKGGGALIFRQGTTGRFATTLALDVPKNGTSVPFFVAGKFGCPSRNPGEVAIEGRGRAALLGTLTLVGRVKCMVRI